MSVCEIVCLALMLEISIFISFSFYIGLYFKEKDLNIERDIKYNKR